MNEQLLSLYASKWTPLCAAMQLILDDETLPIKPTCPLLLMVRDEEAFERAEIRVMVVGQETNSWYTPFHSDLQPIVDQYDRFFNTGECWSYGGQFWNGVKRFQELLQARFPDKTIRLVWNNIVKIGKHGAVGFPPEYIYEAERKHFSVFQNEVNILRPTVVLFLTGPNYDSAIADNFGPVEMVPLHAPFSTRQIAKVSLPGVPSAYRTYHPNYLWRKGINSYFEAIIEQLSLDLGTNRAKEPAQAANT